MPRVVIDSTRREALENKIAHLRGLDLGGLRARWHTTFRRRAPPLPRHLLFRILAYRLQADRLGDLDADSRRLLAGVDVAGSFHAPLWPKPATTLSRKDWHSSANGAVV